MARPTRKTVLAAGAVLAAAAGLVVAARLRATVRRALEPAAETSRPLRFLTAGAEGPAPPHWGSPAVEAVAVTPAGLIVAGGSGVLLVRGDDTVDLTPGLPGLAVSALAPWRGDPVVGLKSGGLFRRRGARWEEARSGWGRLEVRALAETEGGELLIGARQGLFRGAWGGDTLERLDPRPVRAIAERRQSLLAGGEQGLLRIESGRAVALATPDPWIEAVVVDGEMTPEAAVGLRDAVSITPSRLLQAYARLTRTPWLAGDALRREVLAGLRQAAQDGTARGLGRLGFWAKTGTVEDPDRPGLATIGWTLAVDDSGASILARLRPGTGRQAAAALGRRLERPSVAAADSAAEGRVRVLLFEAIRPRSVRATNRGPLPAARSRGSVGPGESAWLGAGERLGESLWRLSLPDRAVERTVKAALQAEAGRDGRLDVVAEMDAREYVSGMIAAELPDGSRAQRVDLGAAALRLRARGPRHARADFCDTTHCAWFIGRGPRLRWPSPRQAVVEDGPLRPVDDEEWARIVEAARRPGPIHWTTHCGGSPLSEYAVWGNGDRSASSCPIHGGAPSRPWTRFWPDDALERAFGGRVTRMQATAEDGVHRLLVESGGTTRRLLYDETHRALAAVLGWDALPSPPDRVTRTMGGFLAEGVGAGHRVGLCLGGGSDDRRARSHAPGSRVGHGDDQSLELGGDRAHALRGTE